MKTRIFGLIGSFIAGIALVIIVSAAQHPKDVKHERYFYITYYFKDGYGSRDFGALWTHQYQFPSQRDIADAVNKNPDNFIVISYTEFKDESEYNRSHTK